MAVKPTREKTDAQRRAETGTAREVDVRDMERNEAPRTAPLGGADADPSAGETAAQDRVPSADDINLEATLLQRSTGQAGVDEWRTAERPDRNPVRPDDPVPGD